MGTRERRQREIAEREQRFLDAARALVCQDGLLHLQMARVADACDYATGTLYQHFAGKEDLLVALLTERVLARAELFQRACNWNATPRDRMFAVAVADKIFVAKHPEHFRIAQFTLTEVVWSNASVERREAYLREMRPLGDIVLGIIGDAVAAGDLMLEGDSAEEIGASIWSLVTGTHHLAHAEGFLESFNVRRPYRVMGRALHQLLNGLGWRPLFDLSEPAAYEDYLKRLTDEVFTDQCRAPTEGRAARAADSAARTDP